MVLRRSVTLKFLLNAACLALALLWTSASALRYAREKPQERVLHTYSQHGEALAHGVVSRATAVSHRLPLATLVSARIHYHVAARDGVLLAVNECLVVLFMFAIGLLLHPYGGPLAAAAVAVLAAPGRDLNLYPDSGYTLLILLTAGLLVWRSRSPSAGRSALLGAAVGATLLWRSPLAFFGPALALYEWAADRCAFKARARQWAILCIVPYLFLLPWIAMNWTVHRQLVIFEKGTANSNVVTGALGLVQNIEGDLTTLVDEPIDTRSTGAVAWWAARQVLRHPLRFARAFALRIAYALDGRWVLVLCAFASFWAFRRRVEHRALAFLAAYFLAIHCLMTVEQRYFWPLWPLLALVACSLPAWPRAADRPADRALEVRLSSWVLRGALAFVFALALGADWTVLSFARLARAGKGDALEQLSAALRAHPRDAWLLGERGKERLSRGDDAGAGADFAAAAALEPDSARARLQLARARALLGKPEGLLTFVAPGAELGIDADILKACAYLRRGRRNDAIARLKSAWESFGARNIVVRGPHGGREREVLARLRLSDAGFSGYCGHLQGPRPAAEKLALNDALAELLPDSSEVWTERASLLAKTGRRAEALRALARVASLKAGRVAASDADLKALVVRAELAAGIGARAEALDALARAEALSLDQESVRARVVEIYRGLREFRRGSAFLAAQAARRPGDASLWLDAAEFAAEGGETAAARAALARADAVKSGDAALLRMAEVHGALKDGARAFALFDELSQRSPRDARPWLSRAALEARRGDRAAALNSLARAEALDPDNERQNDEQRRRIALVYQDLKEYDRAIELLGRLTRQYPGVASFYSDKALCEYLKGAHGAALADLRTAIRLEPKFLPAYLTLGAVLSARGHHAEAAEAYDEALSKTAESDADPLRELVRAARRDTHARVSKK